MIKNGLTITMVFDAASANYGEGIGNISQLKKMTRAGGEVYTYISRQAIRYNIVEQMQINNTPVDNSQKVVQFAPAAAIDEFPEIDLFGYMKTTKGGQSIRSAVVRLSNAVSLSHINPILIFSQIWDLPNVRDLTMPLLRVKSTNHFTATPLP